jgi:hypothetical protein
MLLLLIGQSRFLLSKSRAQRIAWNAPGMLYRYKNDLYVEFDDYFSFKEYSKNEKTIELRVNFEEILNELSIIFTLKYVIYSQNYAQGA